VRTNIFVRTLKKNIFQLSKLQVVVAWKRRWLCSLEEQCFGRCLDYSKNIHYLCSLKFL